MSGGGEIGEKDEFVVVEAQGLEVEVVIEPVVFQFMDEVVSLGGGCANCGWEKDDWGCIGFE